MKFDTVSPPPRECNKSERLLQTLITFICKSQHLTRVSSGHVPQTGTLKLSTIWMRQLEDMDRDQGRMKMPVQEEQDAVVVHSNPKRSVLRSIQLLQDARVIVGVHGHDDTIFVQEACAMTIIERTSVLIGDDAANGAENGFWGTRIPLVGAGCGEKIALCFTTCNLRRE